MDVRTWNNCDWLGLSGFFGELATCSGVCGAGWMIFLGIPCLWLVHSGAIVPLQDGPRVLFGASPGQQYCFPPYNGAGPNPSFFCLSPFQTERSEDLHMGLWACFPLVQTLQDGVSIRSLTIYLLSIPVGVLH